MAEKFKVMIYDLDIDSVRYEKYIGIDNKHLETKEGLYELDKCKKFYNETNGMIYYLINVDLPSKQEASNLKQLRRSAALNNLFKYDVKKPFDIVAFMPWIIILMMVIF